MNIGVRRECVTHSISSVHVSPNHFERSASGAAGEDRRVVADVDRDAVLGVSAKRVRREAKERVGERECEERVLARQKAIEDEFASKERELGPWSEGVRRLLREEVETELERVRDEIEREVRRETDPSEQRGGDDAVAAGRGGDDTVAPSDIEPDDHPDDLDEDYAPGGYWAEENVGDDDVVGDVLPGAADGQAVPGLIPDDSDDDDYYDMEDGLEEARYMKMCRPVLKPTAEQVRFHKAAGHSPFRSWCPTCVRGSANDRAHLGRAEQPIGTIPEVHSDYAFLRNKRGDHSSVPVLVSTERRTGAIAAHVTPKKGIGGGWIVQQYLRDLRKWGIRGKALIRSDGEFALVDLLNRVGQLRQGDTLLEQSPVTDSRANGRAERAVQKVQKKTRVLKLATE